MCDIHYGKHIPASGHIGLVYWCWAIERTAQNKVLVLLLFLQFAWMVWKIMICSVSAFVNFVSYSFFCYNIKVNFTVEQATPEGE